MRYLISALACLILTLTTFEVANAKSYASKGILPSEVGLYAIDSLNELAFKLKRKDTDEALSLLNDALDLSIKKKYKKGEATAYLYEAGIYQQNGYSKRALSLYYKSLDLSRQNKDTFNIARAEQQIGSALLDASDLKGAEKLYKEALQDYIMLDSEEDAVNMYNSLGLLKLEQNEIPEAKKYLTQAFSESHKIGYEYGLKKANFHFGLLYLKLDQLSKSEAYFNKAIKLDKAKDDNYGLSLSYNKMAVICLKRGDYEKAIEFAKTALQHAESIDASKLEIEAIENIISIYKSQKNFENVMKWQSSLIEMQRQLSDKEKSYAINFLDILRKKQEDQLAYERYALQTGQKTKLINYILLIVSFALGIIAIIAPMWYRNYLKVKSYSNELAHKNELIERNAQKLEELNHAVSTQNESLEQSNKMKDKLLSIISHDLRGPLMNTKGVLQIINSGVVQTEDYPELLEELEKQYTKSVVLLDNMLFWIKSQMRGDKIEPKTLKVKSLMQGIVDEQDATRKAKGIVVMNEVDPDLTVSGDKEMLKVVFRNLLSNSLKFTKSGGKVYIKSSKGNVAKVTFHDEGIGMSKEDLERVRAKKYFTTHGTHNEAGSGFGLMICMDLISKNGGKLTIESELNKGSQFTIQLPLAAKVKEEESALQESYTV